MKKITFGTDGWRATIADSFTVENIVSISHAYAEFLKQNNKKNTKNGIAIGYDTRFMSDHFASIVADVISYHGIDVFLSAFSVIRVT